MFNRFPKRSGIYHIKDNINQLEVEIHFHMVNSLLELPKFEVELAQDKQQHGNAKEAQDQVKSVRIKWQQKIFSPTEVELYKDIKNCFTDKQKAYNEWLQQQKRAVEDEQVRVRTKSKRRQKRQQQTVTKSEEHLCQIAVNEIFTYIHEDNHMPSEEQKNEAETLQTMYIYAALNPPVQLVALKWHPEERVLHIYPDFNNFKDNPYFIEIDTDYRHLYAYGIAHTSKTRQLVQSGGKIAPALKCMVELPEILGMLPKSNTEFSFPPKHTHRVVLLLAICEANGFENDNIHVRYHVHLPQGLVVEEGLLEASTHSSHAGCSNKKRHNFGYCWQLTLLYENCDGSDLLHIYFEVISIDSWQRERIEGYTHFSTYLSTPGSFSSQLHCLRPIDSFWYALNRYFIGGRRKFDYVRFFTDTESALHNRLGCRMTHTGNLSFQCQRLVQRSYNLLQPCRDHGTSGMTLDDIMFAYSEARKRLEKLMIN